MMPVRAIISRQPAHPTRSAHLAILILRTRFVGVSPL
jgi:hypothetical protein